MGKEKSATSVVAANNCDKMARVNGARPSTCLTTTAAAATAANFADSYPVNSAVVTLRWISHRAGGGGTRPRVSRVYF